MILSATISVITSRYMLHALVEAVFGNNKIHFSKIVALEELIMRVSY